MNNFSERSVRVIRMLLLAVTLLVLLAPSVGAQHGRVPTGPARPSPTGGRVPENARQPSVRERHYKVLEMEREAANARTPEQDKLALAQIAEDYEKLQVINNKMMATTMRATTPDYGHIGEVTAEIKTRATRMKDNLRLAKVELKKDEKAPSYKKPQDAAEMKTNLLSLDGSIMSFVKNQIFMNPGVVDVKQAEKASRDLESVIELSNLITKDAQRLAKSSEKTP